MTPQAIHFTLIALFFFLMVVGGYVLDHEAHQDQLEGEGM